MVVISWILILIVCVLLIGSKDCVWRIFSNLIWVFREIFLILLRNRVLLLVNSKCFMWL